jgi:drug/metabolite transporter (DMT)-like permease
MLNNFIYSTPTWLWGVVLVLVFVTMATIGLVIFNMVVQIEVRKNHNDVTGFTIAIIAVTYAVLLAFIAVATWETYSRAEEIVDRNDLYGARASRISATNGHIPDMVWWLILLGGMITTGYMYLFGFHSFRMHLVMTAAVSASLALVVVLIMALDWPFRGEVSIAPDAFVNIQHSWAELHLDKP